MPLLAKVWPRMPIKTLVKEKKIPNNPHETAISLFPAISLKITGFVPTTHSSPQRIQYYFHERNSKIMLGLSVQVRICCQLSLSGNYPYQLFQDTWCNSTGEQDGYLSSFQWMCTINTKISGYNQMCRCCTEQPLQKSAQLPPVTHFLHLLKSAKQRTTSLLLWKS